MSKFLLLAFLIGVFVGLGTFIVLFFSSDDFLRAVGIVAKERESLKWLTIETVENVITGIIYVICLRALRWIVPEWSRNGLTLTIRLLTWVRDN